MSFLEIENLSLTLHNFQLQNISLTLPRGKVLVVLGPSGSGKSVLLEAVAGFHRLERGSIRLDGREITFLPPEKRRLGFMFQDYALFPHRTVRQNIAFPRQFLRAENAEAEGEGIGVEQAVELLHLTNLVDRYPANLSGGEKQRVAMARALVCRPQLFLFDEPMSALDARAREELRQELHNLFRELNLTVVYVTHDQTEALALGDLIAVIHQGRLLQCGAREEVFRRPADPFVARFVGMENLLPGRVCRVDGDVVEVHLADMGVITARRRDGVAEGSEVLVGIRPEDIRIIPNRPAEDIPGRENILSAVVGEIYPAGMFYKVGTAGRTPLTVYLTGREMKEAALERGKTIWLGIPAADIHLLTI